MGLTVVVLDGHTTETPKNRGLLQCLANPLALTSEEDDIASWSVIPSVQGFAELSAGGLFASSLGELFKNYAVVLVYAPADCLTRLLKGGSLAPLLVVPPTMSSAITAYQALKQLLMNGQLHPTVANIVLETTMMMPKPMSTPAQKVMDCAIHHLGYDLKALTITASANTDRQQDDLEKLAMQLLENAVPLQRHPTERVH
ncbi:hypothetical protein [Rhodoferax sp.]|uniref:hypothetical protein n=1 Tax=Rhodoferax sp. TaxID=50421 RepID=UPI00284F10DD|nr:hypothetical protein [Rhodoferax sp.]MDR3371376.1 hypothetical protein [Rhodoferax sp.]